MGGLTIKRITDLNYWLWASLLNLYAEDMLAHAYLIYDLMYELSSTDAYFAIREGRLTAYLLIWRGWGVGVHLWGSGEDARELVKYIPLVGESLIVHTYSSDVVDDIVKHVRKYYDSVEVAEFIDMVTDRSSFKPYRPELAARLSGSNPEHVRQLAELMRKSGRANPEEVSRLIDQLLYHGVFVSGRLVSVANSYLRLRDVWFIGSVFTDPEFRGRGYAKAVTSAVTKLALDAGAVAALHVMAGNESAIRAYERIGYRRVRTRKWVLCRRSKSL